MFDHPEARHKIKQTEIMQNETSTPPRTRKPCGRPLVPQTNPVLASYQCSGTIEHRFWSRIDKNGPPPPPAHCPELGPCWLWTGCTDKDGYGKIGRGAENASDMKASKLSWLIHNGDVPVGLCVCHFCDNPPCANPKHLWLGTSQQNTRDKCNKKRGARGENQGSHKLTEAQVAHIRATYAQGGIAQARLAEQFRVAESTIRRIIVRILWRHI